MNTPSIRLLRDTMSQGLWVVAAEVTSIPVLIVTTAFLTRRLSPEGYGVFILVITVVTWAEWMIAALFSRTAIKFVSEADDWKSIGVTILRLNALIGMAAAAACWLIAPLIGALLNEPDLVSHLRWYAIDIPIFCLVQAQRQILVGIGDFFIRALSLFIRWVAQLVFIVLLVESGFSVRGAIFGSIGASVVEWGICVFRLRLSLFRRSAFPVRRLWKYIVPLSLVTMSVRLFSQMDLFLLKALGGTTAQAGLYGVAQGLAQAPGIFTVFAAPVLQSTLGRLSRLDDAQAVRAVSRQAMRAVVGMMPFVCLVIGAAPALIALIAGTPFLPAAPLFSLLIVGALARLMTAATTTILTAAEKPARALVFGGPLIPLALAGHALCIPLLGGVGAALVTAVLSLAGACVLVLMVHRLWGILPPAMTCGRSMLIGILMYFLAGIWPTPGLLVVAKLLVGGVLILGLFFILGEFTARDIALIRSTMRRRIESGISDKQA